MDFFKSFLSRDGFKRAMPSKGNVAALPRVPWPETSFDSLNRYSRKSELVYACIEKKAQAACDPVLVVERVNADGEWEPVEGHAAAMLMKRPNPYEDGGSFMRAWIAAENTAGIFYAEKIMSGAGQIASLYPLLPDRMTYQTRMENNNLVIDYYEYQTGAGTPIKFKPEELIIRRKHGLGSVFHDLSPLQVAIASVDASIASTDYVRAFYNNDGTPSGILKITGRRLSDDEAQHLQQKWKSNYSRNGKNRGGVAILDDAADYAVIGSRLSELDSESLTSIDESRICMAFGVPPILIGAYVGLVHVNQRASVKEAQADFWMNTMSPELKQIRQWLTYNVLPYFEPIESILTEKVRFNWDMTQVDALQEDVDAVHKRAREDYKYGIVTLNEAREQINFRPVEGDEGDAFYSPAPLAEPDPNPEEEDPMTEPKGLMFGIKVIDDADPLEKKTADFEYSREPTPLELSIDLKAIHDSYENGKDALNAVIMQIRGDLIGQAVQVVRKHGDGNISTLTLTPPAGSARLLEREIKNSFITGQAQIWIPRGGKVFSSRHIESKGLIDDLIRKLVELTLARVINEVSTAAINIFTALGVLGLDRDEIESRMRQELEDRSEKPFESIARQTTNRAVNEGRREEMRQREGDIEKYVYSAILDKGTCPNCEQWDGAEADRLDQLPETPNAECEGGSSCRCFVLAVFAEAE